jgi:sugar (pentulose or hexulose) kinase
LSFYPLLQPGERFPINDPARHPCLLPRLAEDALFLHGTLEGIARIEAEGYRLLARLGAPHVRRVTTLGGGAANVAWSAIRARYLGVPVTQAATSSAAHGAALLAARALAATRQ